MLSVVDLSPLFYGCAVFLIGSQAAELLNTQRYTLTFWHLSFTFKFEHTLYVKCEYTGTKKGSIMK
jgi:hypothetical protein